MKTKPHNWCVGTSGWEHEGFDSTLYQMGEADALEKLRYYSRFFETTEVRSTFWDEDISEAEAKGWIAAVEHNSRFQFTFKLHFSFTHKKDLNTTRARKIRGVAQEFFQANRLGGMLAQFPYAFTNTSSHRQYLTKLAELFRGFPIHVEFRHDSWDQSTIVRLLEDCQLRSVSSDLPRISRFIPCLTRQVGDVVYVRLHGRNEKGWLTNEMDSRYSYLYNARELREIIRRIQLLAGNAQKVIVICNNTPEGKGLANALQISSYVQEGKQIPLPPATATAFPFLLERGTVLNDEWGFGTAEEFRKAI